MSDVQKVRIDRLEGSVMAVNTYILEGPDGLVVVDGQLTVSDADTVRTVLESIDKPVAGMILTHGHPDHYAGAGRMLDGFDVPIVATSGVDGVIRRDDAAKDAIVGPMMGDEWPQSRRFPDEIVETGATVRLGGVELTVRDVGPGESHDDTLWTLDDDIVFAGDVAYNGMHAYLADGRFAEWLDLLTALEGEFEDDVKLYVGHGAPTDRSALGRQRVYVEAFVEAVDENRNRNEQQRHDAVVARMCEIVPNDRLLFLMELSIEPVLAALESAP